MQSRWERALELLKKNRGGILSCAREGTPHSLVFHCHPSSWPISSRTPHPPVKGVLPVSNLAPNINLIPLSRSPLAYSRAYLCFRERVEGGFFLVLPEVITRARSIGRDNTFCSPVCNPPPNWFQPASSSAFPSSSPPQSEQHRNKDAWLPTWHF